MRNVFINKLISIAEVQNNIVLVVGDLGYSVVEPFAKRFPDRFFNAGVAEQNMMGFSAGLASEGFHVFVYSIANFPTFRCAEQIRNDVVYHNNAVTIVSVGGGLAYGNLGYSHHAVQDYALLRSLPGMLIASPGDPNEVNACLSYLLQNPQPSYLRIGKAGEPNIHKNIPSVNPGQWIEILRGSNRKTLLCTGATMELALNWIKGSVKYADYSLYSLPLWGMQYKHMQAVQVMGWDSVVTVEDHLVDGGFGSWMLESLMNHPNLIGRVSIKALDSIVCSMVGKQKTLNEAGGLVVKI